MRDSHVIKNSAKNPSERIEYDVYGKSRIRKVILQKYIANRAVGKLMV